MLDFEKKERIDRDSESARWRERQDSVGKT